MVKVHLAALGCKLNESEIEAWSRELAVAGCEVVDDPAVADICIVNTCTVTSQAARKSRATVRQLARLNPRARIVLTGCFATLSPHHAAVLPNVVQVVPNKDKDSLVRAAGSLWRDPSFRALAGGCRMPEAGSGMLAADDLTGATGRASAPFHGQTQGQAQPEGSAGKTAEPTRLRTRAFVKIEDGCNMSCTYCIIPAARGREKSRPPGEILVELRHLVEMGYKEIVLTGVQISDYEYEGDKRRGLYTLVRRILAETDVPRLRLTSIAPWDLDDRLLDLFADSRLCRHLHLSLQSGSDTVLRRMRRPYTSTQYAGVVGSARLRVPGVAITTDVIVGFPGESAVEFDASCAFVESLEFSRVHVFTYSPREGTVAAGFPDQVPEPVKAERQARMQAIADASLRRFAERFCGEELIVLWETYSEDPTGAPVWSGYTDNYIRVQARSPRALQNELTPTLLIETAPEGALGRV